ncbi:SMI1/KNR4 family protein [Paenibacillus donghaensis]|uniref:Knr4/Smi1-like domain-containing protein n=1 Tax=Paenibacillus donghaensis TaxID=414771 RepID=A0A2Z2KJK7_9BACL|nr:SMI1/KNR4 family protein [Paenibacillus donghaensis]ASA22499.1 hypothetical protein B9T62_17950 [Paenibacillus donghaensis]
MYRSLQEKLEHTAVLKWHRGHGVKEEWITAAEQELGYSLPESYKWWLREYGNARLDGAEILTLAPPEFREYADSDLLYNDRLDRQNSWFPEGRLSLLMNGITEIYADTFAGFLEKLIDEREL